MSAKDLKLTDARVLRIHSFQESYLGLVAALGGPVDLVLQTQERSAVINHRHRITGDAVTWIIEVIAMKGKIKIDGLQEAPTHSSTRRSSYPESGVLFQCPTLSQTL